MRRKLLVGATVGAVTAVTTGWALAQASRPSPDASFFITSVGSGRGANLGGLAGADKHCQGLAQAAGLGGTTWRAYLSAGAAGGQPAVDARDRIGRGPWRNVKGVVVAQSVADLHSANNKLAKETSLNEKGLPVNGRGDSPNTHDILTGSKADGTLATGDAGQALTCANWTSDGDGSANLGHHDRQGGGAAATSWNAAHASRGCSQANLVGTGGAGLFYCFATN